MYFTMTRRAAANGRGHVRAVDRRRTWGAIAAVQLALAVPGGGDELGSWSQLADLNTGRHGPGVAVVEGQVFVIGGDCGECSFPGMLASVETYDPNTNSWRYVAPMPEKLGWPAVAALDGYVYVFGGLQENVAHNTNVYRYDPAADIWSYEGGMPDLWEAAAVAFAERIYLVGGRTGHGAGPRTFAFDPQMGTWEPLAPFIGDRIASNNALACSGSDLYLFAALDGYAEDFDNYRISQRYDVATDSWRQLAQIPLARDRVGVAELGGRFFVYGSRAPYAAHHVYDPVSNTWTAAPPLPLERFWPGSAAWRGGVLAVGGFLGGGQSYSRVEHFVPRLQSGVVATCFCGEGSPCANASWTAGCINATGAGASLTATGSTSATADDLILTATEVPRDQLALAVLGGSDAPTLFGNGLRCVGAKHDRITRLALGSSGSPGVLRLGPGIIATSEAEGVVGMVPGSTWAVQFLYRDPGFAPCSSTWNATNAVAITFSL